MSNKTVNTYLSLVNNYDLFADNNFFILIPFKFNVVIGLYLSVKACKC